jgi:hypothetical protein
MAVLDECLLGGFPRRPRSRGRISIGHDFVIPEHACRTGFQMSGEANQHHIFDDDASMT